MASRKTKAPAKEGDDCPGFEEALGQLERLVEAMENEQLPLEQLVANYEQGSKLLSHCQQVLESARERIELITLDNQRDSGLEKAGASTDVGSAPPFSQAETPPSSQAETPPSSQDETPPSSQGPDPDDDDIRLF